MDSTALEIHTAMWNARLEAFVALEKATRAGNEKEAAVAREIIRHIDNALEWFFVLDCDKRGENR